MIVVVHMKDGSRGRHGDATGWHIDEVGDLHIMTSGRGNLASYARGSWASVVRVST